MRARSRSALALALLLAADACAARPLAAQGADAPAAPAPAHTVRGTVRTRDGAPVRGVNVFLLESLEGALSGDDGTFAIRTTLGDATLVTRRIGFVPARVEHVGPSSGALSVVIDAAAAVLAPQVVEAGRYDGGDAPTAALKSLDVAMTPGASSDVLRAVQAFPGLQADESAQLYVRGGTADETRVLLDGLPILAPYRFDSPAAGSFGTIDPFLLDDVFFSAGGFRAEYGDALSGIAALSTRGRPAARQLELTPSLAGASAAVALPLTRRLALRGSLANSDLTLLNRINRKPDFTRAAQATDAAASAVYSYSPRGYVKLFALAQRDAIGVLVPQPGDTTTFANRARGASATASLHHAVGAATATASAGWSAYDRDIGFALTALATRERRAAARAKLTIPAGARTAFSLGGDAQRDEERVAGAVAAVPYANRPGGARRAVAGRGAEARGGAFAEVEQGAFDDHLRLVVGARADAGSRSRTTLDPRASLTLRVRPGVTAFVAAGAYHQAPSLASVLPYARGVAVPAARAVQSSAGAQLGAAAGTLRAELWRKTYADLTQLDARGRLRTGDVGDARGLDVLAHTATWRGADLRVAYSLARVRRTDPNADPNTGALAAASTDVTHGVNAVAGWSWRERLRVSTALRLASGRPVTPVVAARFDSTADAWAPVYGSAYSERLPPLRRLDATASWVAAAGARTVVLFASGVNLTNRTNYVGYGYSRDYATRALAPSTFRRAIYLGAKLATEF